MVGEIKKHPGVSAVLSFVFNGLGQLYNGQIFKGLLIIFFSALAMLVIAIAAVCIGFSLAGKILFPGQLIVSIFLFVISLFFICILGIYSIWDAYSAAKKNGY